MASVSPFDPGKDDAEKNRLAAQRLFQTAGGTPLSQDDARTILQSMTWKQRSQSVFDALIPMETLTALSIDTKPWHDLDLPIFRGAIGTKAVQYFQIGDDFAHVGILAYLEEVAGKEWVQQHRFAGEQDRARSSAPIR